MKAINIDRNILKLLFQFSGSSVAQEIFALNGSTVQLRCPNKGSSKSWINWYKTTDNNLDKQYSEATTLNPGLNGDLKSRLKITGDNDAGEYHLNISDVKESDEGTYKCLVIGEAGVGSTQKLFVISKYT